MKRIHKIIIIIIAVALLFALLFLLLPARKISDDIAYRAEKADPFASISIEAKAVYVFDIVKGEPIFELNKNAQLPLASIVKVMTALVASGEALPGTIVEISGEAIQEVGDDNLLVGERWRLSDILDFTVVKSSNDGASALAQTVSAFSFGGDKESFINKMNELAKEIGLEQTYFLNETGLDVNRNISGAYGSAEDVAKLFVYVLKNNPKILDATQYSTLEVSSKEMKHNIVNSNRLTASVSGILASKTGYTDLAGGNLAVIFDAGFMHPVVAVVLGSSQEGRFEDMEKIMEATLTRLK
ncbi:MAG: serine hydrolase [Parcubacteria group bacterium]|nr:serine hydrolase [Parcubacteria group bacterium]MCR4342324.1 serine hydrolase [Patescibacteria group bacterium]